MTQDLPLWINDAGQRLSVADHDAAVRDRLGVSADDLPHASDFAIRNLGWIQVTLRRGDTASIAQIALRYDSERAEPSAMTALATLVGAAWRGSPLLKLSVATAEAHTWVPVRQFLSEQLPYDLQIAQRRMRHPSYDAERLPPDTLAQRADTRHLSELLVRWHQNRDYGGSMPLLLQPRVFTRSGVFTISDGTFHIGWIGPAVGIYQNEKLVGRNVLDQPDLEYSSCLAADYTDIVASGEPRVSHVRATIEGRPYVYLRLVLPYYSNIWQPARATELVTSHIQLPRSHSPAS